MTPLEIAPIPASVLHHHWRFVETGLRVIQKQNNAEWWPEDHYSYIANGRAELFLMSRQGRILGFYDAYPTQIAINAPEMKYFVWAVYSLPPAARWEEEDRDSVIQDRKAVIEFIQHRAREHRCRFIETTSNRKFFYRIGFEEHAVIFRMEVDK